MNNNIDNKDVNINDDNGKKKNKKLLFIIIISVVVMILFIVLFMIFGPKYLVSNKDSHVNDENIKFLVDTYGNDVKVTFLDKKKNKNNYIWTYRICGNKSLYCAEIKYDDKGKDWIYPKGETFINTLIFMEQSTSILDKNNISYKEYTDNKVKYDMPNTFILVIKKDNTNTLVDAIREIDNNNLIDKLCFDDTCTGKFEISIFNSNDYDIITKKLSKSYGVNSYEDLYAVLYKNDKVVYGKKLGENIERHSIDNNMFNCTSDDCNSYKHLAYRYVIGNHNHVNNTMIVEGIN